MRLARIKYLPALFEVEGPPELLGQMGVLLAVHNLDLEEWVDYWDAVRCHWQIFLEWGVPCSVCNEMITLAELNYWDCEKQAPFKGPEQVLAGLVYR